MSAQQGGKAVGGLSCPDCGGTGGDMNIPCLNCGGTGIDPLQKWAKNLATVRQAQDRAGEARLALLESVQRGLEHHRRSLDEAVRWLAWTAQAVSFYEEWVRTGKMPDRPFPDYEARS